MSTQEINNLKLLLQKHGSTNYVDSVTEGITEEGFLFLMQVFVMKDHTETVWMAMRKFKYNMMIEVIGSYDDSFQLTEGVSDITFEPDQSVELTTEGRMFLTTVRINSRVTFSYSKCMMFIRQVFYLERISTPFLVL